MKTLSDFGMARTGCNKSTPMLSNNGARTLSHHVLSAKNRNQIPDDWKPTSIEKKNLKRISKPKHLVDETKFESVFLKMSSTEAYNKFAKGVTVAPVETKKVEGKVKKFK